MRNFKNKTKILSGFLARLAVLAFYVVFSLACASTCTSSEAFTQTIKIQDVNNYVKNQEINLMANNGLTGDELMEIIKISIKNGELKDLTIVEENAKLSYGVLSSSVELYKNKPIYVDFSCTISKGGSFKLKIIEIREQDPINKPFKFVVDSSEYEPSLDNIKVSILKHLENIGKKILSKSEDFA